HCSVAAARPDCAPQSRRGATGVDLRRRDRSVAGSLHLSELQRRRPQHDDQGSRRTLSRRRRKPTGRCRVSAAVALIDVWHIDTFDANLRGDLDCHAELIRDYFLTSRRQWLERELSDRQMLYPENPYASKFLA